MLEMTGRCQLYLSHTHTFPNLVSESSRNVFTLLHGFSLTSLFNKFHSIIGVVALLLHGHAWHLLTLWKHLCIVGLNRTLKPVWFPGYQTHFCMYRVTEPPTLFHITDYKVTCTSDGLPPCDGDCQIKPSAAGKIRHSGIRENTVVTTHTIY